ncbi:MAG: hypothetical protein LBC20_05150, partial [Planctomycetaceae bacterium]|nr:hypothetical protein [Planctomycetaceae bacterium]
MSVRLCNPNEPSLVAPHPIALPQLQMVQSLAWSLVRSSNLFHLKQVDDPKNKFQHLIDTKINADYDAAQKIIDTSGAKIRNGGNRACYTLPGNYIKIPFKKQFES